MFPAFTIGAADIPECRAFARNEEMGPLVPARDPIALADAVDRPIVYYPERRNRRITLIVEIALIRKFERQAFTSCV